MSLINTTTLLLFVALFVPGFIYIKAATSIRATDKVDFSKSWYDAAGYGCLFFLFAALITFILMTVWPMAIEYGWMIFLFLLFLMPLGFVILSILVYKLPIVHEHFMLPEETAWDYVFSRRKPYWVIVHLKNGKIRAGLYAEKSYATAYPGKKDIFLQEEWIITLTGRFVSAYNASNGVWIPEEQIAYVRFFRYGLMECSKQRKLIQWALSLKHIVRLIRHNGYGVIPLGWKKIRRKIRSWRIIRIIRVVFKALQCKDHL